MNINDLEDALRAELGRAEGEVARLRAALVALSASANRPPPVQPSPEPGWQRRRVWTTQQKRLAVARAWGPAGVGPAKAARELGAPVGHLHKWRILAADGKL